MVIIGPGDIFSSLMQVLLIEGMIEAIKSSKAKKVYVCNLMTKNGESNNFKVSDFVKEVENYLKCELDYVMFNTNMSTNNEIKDYRKNNPQFLEMVDFSGLPKEKKYVGGDFLLKEGGIIHDSKKVADIIIKICK